MSQSSTKNARKQENKIIKIKAKIYETENKEIIERFKKPKADLREGGKN